MISFHFELTAGPKTPDLTHEKLLSSAITTEKISQVLILCHSGRPQYFQGCNQSFFPEPTGRLTPWSRRLAFSYGMRKWTFGPQVYPDPDILTNIINDCDFCMCDWGAPYRLKLGEIRRYLRDGYFGENSVVLVMMFSHFITWNLWYEIYNMKCNYM